VWRAISTLVPQSLLIASVCSPIAQSKLPGGEQPSIVDPTHVEEKHQEGSLLVALMPSRNEITQIVQTGELSHRVLTEVRLDTVLKIASLFT